MSANDARRRALELLADAPAGTPMALANVDGITRELVLTLVSEGLATVSTETVTAGRNPIQRERVKITEAGRRAFGSR